MRITKEQRAYRKAIDALAAAWKHPHHGRCGRCRVLSYLVLLEGDTADLLQAKRLCEEHAASGVDLGMPKCRHDACALHERLPFALARRLLRIERRKLDVEDDRGRKLGAIEVPGQVGTILVEFTRSYATIHLWVNPLQEDTGADGLPDSIALDWDRHFAEARALCIARYRELLDLAKADLEFEPATEKERRAPFRKTS